LAGVALAAIGAGVWFVDLPERVAPAGLTQGGVMRPVNRQETRCEGTSGSCTQARFKPDAPPGIRAVLADPSVRGFVGLANYAWEFDDPNRVPGFGPLSVEERERILALMTADRDTRPAFDVSTRHASLQSVRLTDEFDTTTQ
jgi:hypothetical protein